MYASETSYVTAETRIAIYEVPFGVGTFYTATMGSENLSGVVMSPACKDIGSTTAEVPVTATKLSTVVSIATCTSKMIVRR